jgi:hypothetical protein
VLYRPQLVERRLLFLNRHILGYNLLWGGIKAEYDKMRKEFSYLHFVSLPTGHVEPSAAEAALPLLTASHTQSPALSAESEHHDEVSSGVSFRDTGSSIGTSHGGSGIGASSSGSAGLKDSLQSAKTERERKNKLNRRVRTVVYSSVVMLERCVRSMLTTRSCACAGVHSVSHRKRTRWCKRRSGSRSWSRCCATYS